MVPTFLQKRRSSTSSLRVGLTLIALVILLIVYALATSFIIADRAATKTGKLLAITVLSVIALLGLGLFVRLRR